MTHGSLFSGIGGFEYAAKLMNWENVFHCEWNEFGQKVLKYHYPKSKSYADITKTNFNIYKGRINVLTGGFPCQPYSQAGKRLGTEDNRHLWPEMLRAIREIQPNWIVAENVYGLTNWNDGLVFNEIQTDLENEGYTVQPFLIPAASVNAPHKRERVWIVAHANHNGDMRTTRKNESKSQKKQLQKRNTIQQPSQSSSFREFITNTNHARTKQPVPYNTNGSKKNQRWQFKPQPKFRTVSNTLTNPTRPGSRRKLQQQPKKRKFRRCNCSKPTFTHNLRARGRQNNRQRESKQPNKNGEATNWQNFPTQSPICSRNDGFSTKLHGITFPKWRNESIKAYGNAIVPQVALQIFKAIEQYQNQKP